ncbi:MAG: hypothetical protein RLO52_06850 [Sandaracinaceae bacterium]
MRGAMALWTAVGICLGCAHDAPHRGAGTPAVSQSPAPSSAPTAAEVDVEVTCPPLVGPSSLDELPDAASALETIDRVFAALRAGRPAPASLTTSWFEPREASRALVAQLAPCPSALTPVDVGAYRLVVEVRVHDRGAPLGRLRIELARPEGRWLVSPRFLDHLADLSRLTRFEALLRRDDPAIVTRVHARESWVGEGAARVLCVHAPPDTRCFEGSLLEGDVDVFFDVGSHLCLVPSRGPSYVLRWPDGEPWRGVCGEDGHLDAPAPELRTATPPFDPTILAHVGLRRDPSGVTLLESSTGRRVCVGRSDTLTCADLPYTDSLLLSTDIDDMQLAQQAGTGWLALRQHVGDGGAEANVGVERLLVFELRGGELRFHGAIVLGRHTSERLEHDPPSRSIWRTDQVRHADVTLRGSGCLTVGPQTAVSRITDRFRRGWSRERTRRTQPRAGDRLAGDEPLDLYVDGPPDVSGHWVPRAEGGFARASICN